MEMSSKNMLIKTSSLKCAYFVQLLFCIDHFIISGLAIW